MSLPTTAPGYEVDTTKRSYYIVEIMVLISQNQRGYRAVLANRLAKPRFARLSGPFLLTLLLTTTTVFAQSTSVLSGVVRDSQGGLLPGATVTLSQPSSGLQRVATTSFDGHFEFANLPVGIYQVQVVLAGFLPAQRRADLSWGLPVALDDLTLALAAVTDTVDVRPETPVVDTTTAGTRHAISVTRIDRLPVAVSSRGLESVLVAFPGFSQNANGAIHPRGAHNQMTFMVDGLAISDQLTI